MRVPGIYVEISGDYTQFQKDLKQVRTEVRAASTDISNSLNNALSPKTIQKNTSRLVSDLATVNKQAALSSQTFKDLGIDLSDFTKHTGLSAKELKNLQSRLLEQQATRTADASMARLKDTLNLTTAETIRLRMRMGDMPGAFREMGVAANTHIAAVTRRITALNAALVGFGLGFGINEVMDEFGEYETALKSMTRVTERELGIIKEEILELPSTLGKPTELMTGYYASFSAGAEDAASAMDILVTGAKTAKVAQLDQGLTIEGLTKTLAGYRGELKNTTEAADLLFGIERAGQTTVKELIPVIGDLAAMSNNLAIGSREMGGALAQVTQTAGSTSQAATQYKAILTALITPNKEMAEGLKSIEERSAKTAIENRGLVGTLEALYKAVDRDETALAKMLGSSEALSGFLAIASKDFADTTEKIQGMAEGVGTLQKSWDEYLDSWEGMTAAFDATVSKLKIILGEELSPVVKDLLRDLETWLIGHRQDIREFGEAAGETIRTIVRHAQNLWQVWVDLPGWAQGVGVLGVILTGRKGALGLVAALHIMDAVRQSSELMAAAARGDISWFEAQATDLMNSYDRAERILRSLQPVSEMTAAELKKHAGFLRDEIKEVSNTIGELMDKKEELESGLTHVPAPAGRGIGALFVGGDAEKIKELGTDINEYTQIQNRLQEKLKLTNERLETLEARGKAAAVSVREMGQAAEEAKSPFENLCKIPEGALDPETFMKRFGKFLPITKEQAKELTSAFKQLTELAPEFDQFPIDRLAKQVRELDEWFNPLLAHFEEAAKKNKALTIVVDALREAHDQAVVGIRNRFIEGLKDEADQSDLTAHALQNLADAAGLISRMQSDYRGLMDTLNGIRFDNQVSRLKGWDAELARINRRFDQMLKSAEEKGILADTASAIEAVRQQTIAAQKAVYDAKGATDDWTKSWERMAQTLQEQLSNVFYDLLNGSTSFFESIEQSFKRFLANVMAEYVTSGIKDIFKPSETDGTGIGTESAPGQIMSQTLGSLRRYLGFGTPVQGKGSGGLEVGTGDELIGSYGTSGGWADSMSAANPYLAGATAAMSLIPRSESGNSAGDALLNAGQYAAAGAMVGGSIVPGWGHLIGGVIGGLYGGLSTAFGGGAEAPNLQIGFRQGEGDRTWFESARHLSQSGGDWSSSQNVDFINAVKSYFDSLDQIVRTRLPELMAQNVGWEFQTEDVETMEDAFTDVAANIIMNFADDLFGPGSIFATTSKETFGHMAKDGEDWKDVVVRLADAIIRAKDSMEELEETSLAISGKDPYGVQAFKNEMADAGESISLLWKKFNETNDPSEQIDHLNEIKALVVDRYESEKAFVEGLRYEMESLTSAQYEFTTRVQAKIDSLTGSSEVFGMVWNRTVALWNQFQNEDDPARKLQMLEAIESGLDEALAMQTAVIEAEITLQETRLASLDQLRSLSADIGSTLAGFSGDYSDQIGYAFSQAQASWNAGLALEPDDIEGRAAALQQAYSYLQQAYSAATASINAHYDTQIKAIQEENKTLQASRDAIQKRISALNEEKRLVEESYRDQIDALNEQIQAAEEWKRVSESIAEQILDMKLGWTNQQDIFERVDIAREEIARVQELYAGAGTDEERIQYAGQLQGLYGDLLNLGQEAWQRPSPEYQELYQEVLNGLEGIQADADANAGDTAELQEQIAALNEEQAQALWAISQEITDQQGLLDGIDARIEANNTEITRLDTERNQALTDLNTQYSGHLKMIQDEANRLDTAYREPTKDALEAAKDSLSAVQSTAASFYADIRNFGSSIYDAELKTLQTALDDYLGPNADVTQYLSELKDGALADLSGIYNVMNNIHGFLTGSDRDRGGGAGGSLPEYADGGLALTPQIAKIAEKGPEVILPLSRLSDGGSAGGNVSVSIADGAVNLHFEINVHGDTDPEAVGRKVASVAEKVLGNKITDIVVESVKRGKVGRAIKDEARFWK